MALINVDGILIDGVEIPLPEGEAARPAFDMPVKGERRIVKTLNLPGIGIVPILWTSPYAYNDPDLKARCRYCAVLLAKGPPASCSMISVPEEALKLEQHETVVEW